MTNREIKIQRAWLEGLLEYAERTERLVGTDYEAKLKYGLADLLGFISSAKDILKYL